MTLQFHNGGDVGGCGGTYVQLVSNCSGETAWPWRSLRQPSLATAPAESGSTRTADNPADSAVLTSAASGVTIFHPRAVATNSSFVRSFSPKTCAESPATSYSP